MLPLLVVLGAGALAADLQPTLALPTAVSLPAGTGQGGGGAIARGASANGALPSLAGTVRGSAGITDRLAFNLALALPRDGLLLGLRYNVVQTDTFRLAPFVFGLASSDLVLPGTTPGDALSAGLGVALEGGGTVTRFDLSLPLVATGVDPLANPLYVPFAGTSLGVTVLLPHAHSLRVGVESLVSPAIGYRYARDRWYLQATALYSVLRAQPMFSAEAGLRL
jgi:hypothetical protein